MGVIALWRAHVDPFDDRTVGLVTTFAAQGVIAIRNVQLFQELEQRSKQLSRRSTSCARSARSARRSARASTSTRC